MTKPEAIKVLTDSLVAGGMSPEDATKEAAKLFTESVSPKMGKPEIKAIVAELLADAADSRYGECPKCQSLVPKKKGVCNGCHMQYDAKTDTWAEMEKPKSKSWDW